MQVFKPKSTGFCPGVKNAEVKILALKEKNVNQEILILGQLIHNKD